MISLCHLLWHGLSAGLSPAGKLLQHGFAMGCREYLPTSWSAFSSSSDLSKLCYFSLFYSVLFSLLLVLGFFCFLFKTYFYLHHTNLPDRLSFDLQEVPQCWTAGHLGNWSVRGHPTAALLPPLKLCPLSPWMSSVTFQCIADYRLFTLNVNYLASHCLCDSHLKPYAEAARI